MTDTSRVDEILADWRERCEQGEALSQEDVVREHPDLADSLRARFDALHGAEAVWRGGPALRRLDEDRYHSFRKVGEGGMGIVYWALDTDLNRQVAFKVIRPDLGADAGATPSAPLDLAPPAAGTPASAAFETLKHRFLQEAWVTAGLEHPGIVPVYELGRTPEGVPYYTMRFVRGERTLATAIEEARGGALDDRLALLEPFLRVCDTLRYAHAHGVVHRDLKPENIALGEFGEVVVLDWGLAKMRDRPDRTGEVWQERLRDYRSAADLRTLASAMGTPGYMSPEAALGRVAEVDERSDVYSLGAILYQILTGRLPYVFESYVDLVRQMLDAAPPAPHELAPQVPAALSSVCLRALARNRDARPASADALAREVREWQARREEEHALDALRREARAALVGAAAAKGDARLAQLDRAAAAASQVRDRRPDDEAAAAALAEVAAQRECGVREREQAARGRALRRAAVVATAVAAAGAVLVAVLLDQRRRETVRERDAKVEALADAVAAHRATDQALASVRAERDAKDAALQRTRALALVGAARDAAARDRVPLALRLAREAVAVGDHAAPEALQGLYEVLEGAVPSVVFRGHTGPLRSAEISPAGDRVLTVSEEDGTARVWNLDGRCLHVIGGSPEPVGMVATSTGPRLAVARSDGTVELRDPSGTRVAELAGHLFPVVAVAGSADGRVLATASEDGTARLWAADGRALASLTGHLGALTDVAVSPAGDRVATASVDGTARIFDVAGRLVARLSGHRDVVRNVVFSSDGERVVTGSDDGTARVWSAAGAQLAVLEGRGGRVLHIDAAGRSGQVLTLADDGRLRVWDPAGERIATLGVEDTPVVDGCFEPGGGVLFGDAAGVLRLWSGEPGPGRELARHAAPVLHLAASPEGVLAAAWADGTLDRWSSAVSPSSTVRGVGGVRALHVIGGDLISIHDDGSARVFGPGADSTPRVAYAARLHVTCAAFVDDGSRVVTGSDAGAVAVWSTADARELIRVEVGEQGVRRVCPSPDGASVLVVLDWDFVGTTPIARRARVVDVRSSQVSDLPLSATGDDTVFVDQGRRLAAIDADTVCLFELAGSEVSRLEPLGRSADVTDVQGVRAFAVARGLERLAVFEWSGHASVRTLGGDIVWEAQLADYVDHVTFSRTARWVAGVSTDGLAYLLDEHGRVLTTVRTFEDERLSTGSDDVDVGAIAPTEDLWLTVGDGAAVVRVWDFEGRPVARLSGHASGVVQAAFTGPRQILTASSDGTARLWDLARRLHRPSLPTVEAAGVTFLPDGERLLVDHPWKGGLLLGLDGAQQARCFRDDSPRLAPRFSPDGALVVVPDWGCTARLLDARGDGIARLDGHGAAVSETVFSPSGDRLLTVSSGDGVARLWDPQGNLLGSLGGPGRRVVGACFPSDGSPPVVAVPLGDLPPEGAVATRVPDARIHYAAPSPLADRTACIIDGELVVHLADGSPASPGRRAWGLPRFSPDGRWIALGTWAQCEALLDRDGRPPPFGACRGAWSSDGRWLLTWTDEAPPVLRDAAGVERRTLGEPALRIRAAAFAQAGDRVALVRLDGTLVVHALPDGDLLESFEPAEGHVLRAEFEARGPALIVVVHSGGLGAVQIVRVAAGRAEPLTTWGEYHHRSTTAVASPSGSGFLVFDNPSRGAALFDADGEELARVEHRDRFEREERPHAHLSASGDRVVTTHGRSAYVWNTSGELLAALHGHDGDVRSCDVSRDGTRAVTVDSLGVVRAWQVSTSEPTILLNQPVSSGPFPHRPARRAACGADGALLVTDGDRVQLRGPDGAVRWEAHGLVAPADGSGAEFLPGGQGVLLCAGRDAVLHGLGGDLRARFVGHAAEITQATSTPDGQRVLTTSADGTARVWDLDGACVAELRGHHGPARCVAATPDGSLLATGGADGTTRLWTADGQCVAVFRRPRGAVTDLEFSPCGRWLASTAADDPDVFALELVEVDHATLVERAASAFPHPFSPEEAAALLSLLPRDRLTSPDRAATVRTLDVNRLLRDVGDAAEAVRVLTLWADDAPEDQAVRLALAAAHLLDGEIDVAVAEVVRAPAPLTTDAADWLVATGRTLAEWDAIFSDEIEALWRGVTELEPDLAEGWTRLGLGHLHANEIDLALDALARADACATRAPVGTEIARRLGRAVALERTEEEGAADAAAEQRRAARELAPWCAQVLALEARDLVDAERWEEALELARRAASTAARLRGVEGLVESLEPMVPTAEDLLALAGPCARARRAVPEGPVVVVLQVLPGTQAEALGLEAGDVIRRVGDRAVTDFESFRGAWADVPADAPGVLLIARPDGEYTFHPRGGTIGVRLRGIGRPTRVR